MTYSVLQTPVRNKSFRLMAGEPGELHVQIDPFEQTDKLRVVVYDNYMATQRVLEAVQKGYLAGYVSFTVPSDELKYGDYYYQLQKQAESAENQWNVVAEGNITSDAPRLDLTSTL